MFEITTNKHQENNKILLKDVRGEIQYHQLGTMEIEITYKLKQLQKQTKTNVFIRFWNIFLLLNNC